ncbi:MAG: CrcB family protein [Spirochaetes bacterium]|nr:CrcB family protein [Spirochaetota bacterium]
MSIPGGRRYHAPTGNLLLIFLRGGLGAASRYGVTKLFNALFQAVALPLGTLFVNVTGSFALGLVVAPVDAKALSGAAVLAGFLLVSALKPGTVLPR